MDSNDFFQLLIYFFSLITHTKVAKGVLSGEPDHFQPFSTSAEGLFVFFNYFSEKEGFLNRRVVLGYLQ